MENRKAGSRVFTDCCVRSEDSKRWPHTHTQVFGSLSREEEEEEQGNKPRPRERKTKESRNKEW